MSEEQAGAVMQESPNVAAEQTTDAAVTQASAPAPDQQATEGQPTEKKEPREDRTDPGIKRELARLRERARQAEEGRAWMQQKFETVLNRVIGGTQQAQPQGAPTREQFSTDAEYIDALATSRARAAVDEAMRTHQESLTKAQQMEALRRMSESWRSKLANVQQKYPDWDDVVDQPDVPLTDAMQTAILTSDVGTDVAYFLGKNPEEARRIAGLSPIEQARAIGRIEAKLSPSDPTPQREVSKAPAPIKPVGSASGTDGGTLNENLSMADWLKRRNAQVHRKR